MTLRNGNSYLNPCHACKNKKTKGQKQHEYINNNKKKEGVMT
jgi:hypothetical protein